MGRERDAEDMAKWVYNSNGWAPVNTATDKVLSKPWIYRTESM